MFLKAKAANSNEYNPNWWETMCITFYDEYWKADCKYVETLYNIGDW